MTQPAQVTPEQEELFGLTKKAHAEALKIMSDVLLEHCKATSHTPTNAMQFAVIDGFMAAAGQVLAAMTVDTISGSDIPEQRILDGSIGALFMFQKTLENIFAETLDKGNVQGIDVSKMIRDFEKDYQTQKAKS